MAGYKISITNSEGAIEFSTAGEDNAVSIKSVEFRMNTLNDDTRNRADTVRAEFEIKGKIDNNNRDNTLKLLNWSIDKNQKTLYRDVEVIVYNSENCSGDVLRRYDISNMFVIDYEEFCVNEENSQNKETLDFRLFIAQKDGDKTIKVYSS